MGDYNSGHGYDYDPITGRPPEGFDGAPEAVDGRASVARDRPGFGLSLRTADAERYEI